MPEILRESLASEDLSDFEQTQLSDAVWELVNSEPVDD